MDLFKKYQRSAQCLVGESLCDTIESDNQLMVEPNLAIRYLNDGKEFTIRSGLCEKIIQSRLPFMKIFAQMNSEDEPLLELPSAYRHYAWLPRYVENKQIIVLSEHLSGQDDLIEPRTFYRHQIWVADLPLPVAEVDLMKTCNSTSNQY